MRPVEISSRVEAELALWRATAELAAALPRGSWTLVGAQMVFLLAYEHGLPIGRTSGDVDLLMDVRALTGARRRHHPSCSVWDTSSRHRRPMDEPIASVDAGPSSMSSLPTAPGDGCHC